MTPPPITRRSFLLAGLGWFPLFRKKEFACAGIRFRIERKGRSKRRYLLLHGDEETARGVLTAHLKKHSGVAHLAAGNTRTVYYNGVRFDPNRIWSAEGAARNLKLLNPYAPERDLANARWMLNRERGRLIEKLMPPRGGLLIALHNNSRGYSVETEIPISDRAALADKENPHEFFLCTDPADFVRLARSPYNVVLQDKAPQTDDGSLSRLAARLGVRYVNLEAGLGKADRQREMLEWLEKNL